MFKWSQFWINCLHSLDLSIACKSSLFNLFCTCLVLVGPSVSQARFIIVCFSYNTAWQPRRSAIHSRSCGGTGLHTDGRIRLHQPGHRTQRGGLCESLRGLRQKGDLRTSPLEFWSRSCIYCRPIESDTLTVGYNYETCYCKSIWMTFIIKIIQYFYGVSLHVLEEKVPRWFF